MAQMPKHSKLFSPYGYYEGKFFHYAVLYNVIYRQSCAKKVVQEGATRLINAVPQPRYLQTDPVKNFTEHDKTIVHISVAYQHNYKPIVEIFPIKSD